MHLIILAYELEVYYSIGHVDAKIIIIMISEPGSAHSGLEIKSSPYQNMPSLNVYWRLYL